VKRKVFVGFLFGLFLLISVVGCRSDNQSVVTPTSTETSEAIEISIVTPTETPALRLEITFPTSAVAVQTPVAPESSGKEGYTPPSQSEVETVETPEPGPEFTGLTQEALEEAREQAQETAREFPIAQILPYGGPPDGEPFAIYSPTSEGKIVIIIDSAVDFEEVKGEALDWIWSQGYNPADYDIEFSTRPFSQK